MESDCLLNVEKVMYRGKLMEDKKTSMLQIHVIWLSLEISFSLCKVNLLQEKLALLKQVEAVKHELEIEKLKCRSRDVNQWQKVPY